jgi:hypothetical protein
MRNWVEKRSNSGKRYDHACVWNQISSVGYELCKQESKNRCFFCSCQSIKGISQGSFFLLFRRTWVQIFGEQTIFSYINMESLLTPYVYLLKSKSLCLKSDPTIPIQRRPGDSFHHYPRVLQVFGDLFR